MKVCSGTAKGMILKSPRGMDVRPTSARVRQAVFSALSGRIAGSHVLDLYAGTGAMGIEALSRGAVEAVFVELSPRCLRAIKQNLELTGFSHKATILKGDVLRILRNLSRQNRKFDVVIADPPYEVRKPAGGRTSLGEKTLKALGESGILCPNSVVVLEHLETGSDSETAAGLRLVSVRKYGGTAVSFFCPAERE